MDVDLVTRWLSGDLDAADALVERHFDGLLAYARRRQFGGLEPEEAVQNVFLKLIEKVRLWDPSGGTLRAWLVTILDNEFRAAYRVRTIRQKHDRLLAYQFGRSYYIAPPTSPCDQHDVRWFEAEVQQSIKLVLDRLRPKLATFLLQPAKGFSCADRAALSRARRQIARNLGIGLVGPRLTVRIARELLLARECGKLPMEAFQ